MQNFILVEIITFNFSEVFQGQTQVSYSWLRQDDD